MCKLLEDFAKEMKEEWTAEAKAEAKAKGKIENGKETALKMIEDGLPLETIVRYSGLTLEQVEELAKKV
jgi:predicted transposase YdaD